MVDLRRALATDPERSNFGPGNYLAEVKRCEFKKSSNGHPMFSVMLAAVDHDMQMLCFDTLMLGGGGHGIGIAKLDRLGFADREALEPGELVGARAIVAVDMGEYQGKKRLEVDIGAEGSKCGYWLWDGDDAPPVVGAAPVSTLAPIQPVTAEVPLEDSALFDDDEDF